MVNMYDCTRTFKPVVQYASYIEDFESSTLDTLMPHRERWTVTEVHLEDTKTDIKLVETEAYDTDNKDFSQIIINEEVKRKTKYFEKEFVGATKGIFIESGCTYDFEVVFEKYSKKNKLVAIKLLNKLLQKYYADDLNVVTAILHTLSHYSYSELGEEFVFQVLSLCNHKNKKIKKFALKIFDNWDDVETLPLLVGTSVLRESWLESYRQSIIKHLKGKKDALLGTCNKP